MEERNFAASRPFTLGVELELQLVDTERFDLTPAASEVLLRLSRRHFDADVKPEITRSMLEIATGVCESHAEVLDQLQRIRDMLVIVGDEIGIGIAGGGTHAFQDWSQRNIYDTPRFQAVAERYGYLAKQFTVFGQHVHIGCPTPETALRLLHGMSRYVPHLIALSASSPLVRGVDTGFASARLNSVSAFPLSGRAPFTLDWVQFERYLAKMQRMGIADGMKDFYWDIRPKPEFGTIEVRVLDTPQTVEKAAALSAYIQCLARHILLDSPFELREEAYLPYAYNRFQACRYGTSAEIVDPDSEKRYCLRDGILQSFEMLAPHAQALGAQGALDELKSELQTHGNDSDRIRAIPAASAAAIVKDAVRRWRS